MPTERAEGGSTPLFDLPGQTEKGKRTETVEWGVRWTRDIEGLFRRGAVDLAPSRQYAEARAAYMFGGAVGEVVARTVVTFTSDWAAEQPVSAS